MFELGPPAHLFFSYPNILPYRGGYQHCCFCGRKFVDGEVISVLADSGRALCFSDVNAGCFYFYLKKNIPQHQWPKVMFLWFRFGGFNLSNMAPNYPNPYFGDWDRRMYFEGWMSRLWSRGDNERRGGKG